MKKALRIDVDGTRTVLEYHPDDEYTTLRDGVGGYIEAVDMPSVGVVMWCNEEGKINGLPVNAAACEYYEVEFGALYDIIVGPVVFTGMADDNGNMTSIPEELLPVKEA